MRTSSREVVVSDCEDDRADPFLSPAAVTDLLANSSEEQRQLLVEAAMRGEGKILPHQLPVGVDLK